MLEHGLGVAAASQIARLHSMLGLTGSRWQCLTFILISYCCFSSFAGAMQTGTAIASSWSVFW